MVHRLLPFAVTLLLVATLAPTAQAYDPALRWRTIETPHFRIHYHQGGTILAYKGARVFEEIHAILTEDLDRELHRKMDVVLLDATDDANGFASSVPYPSVVLYTTAPMARQSLEGYDDWLWGLFVHEYTHILHIDTTEGINKVWRTLFGGQVKVNRLQPGWMIEGFAVYNESFHSGGGRNRSSWADMLVRMSVLDNRFPTLGQADGYVDMWPGGHYRYIWGGRFHQWVAERHGHGIWTEMSHRHAAQLIPLVIPGKKVFGERLTTMWKAWQADLTTRYRGQQRTLMEAGLTTEELLTTHPDFASRPVASPDGEWIYHSYRHYRGATTIRRMRADGSEARVLNRHFTPQGLTVSDDGSTLYFAASRPHAIWYDFFDLYRFDLDGKRPFRRQRLTRGARTRDPDLHPDGERLVCVVNGLGHNDLAIWSEADGVRRITATDDYTQFADPRWSPDGSLIAVSTWLPGGYRDILLYTAEGELYQRLTEDRAVDIEPTWSPDGEYLLFSSDRTGIYNIFAVRRTDGALLQVTSVIGGAFHPAVTSDGQWLVYEGYTSEGTDIRRAVYAPSTWTPYTEPPPPLPAATRPLPPETEQPLPSTPYSPFPSLLPAYILPTVDMLGTQFTAWDVGARTGGRDALRMHYWGADLSYRTDHRYLSWGAWYELARFHPDVRVGYYTYSLSQGRIWLDHDQVPGGVGVGVDGIFLGEDVYLEKRHRAYLHLDVPLHARHSVWAEYQFDHHQALSDVPDEAYAPLLPGQGSYSGLELGYVFSQTRGYRYSISPEAGFQASLSADMTYPWLGAKAVDWTGTPITLSKTAVAAEVRAYFTMPWWRNHVLAVRAAGGTTFGVPGDVGEFRLGGAYSEGSYIGAPSHGYQLRGYPGSVMVGDHLALLSTEYRFPIVFFERGFDALPLYLRGIHLAAVFDIGQAWRTGDYPTTADLQAGTATVGGILSSWLAGLRPGIALEVKAELIPLWNGMLRVELGYQLGLGQGGIEFGPDSFYLHLGSSF